MLERLFNRRAVHPPPNESKYHTTPYILKIKDLYFTPVMLLGNDERFCTVESYRRVHLKAIMTVVIGADSEDRIRVEHALEDGWFSILRIFVL